MRLRAKACLAAALAAIGLTACGTGTGAGTQGKTAQHTSTRKAVPTADATPSCSSSPRLPPIIYRPSGLSTSQKVPLLIALHGSGGAPQNMEGLSHFEHVADEHGFVVAYLASCNLDDPWEPPPDLPYISSEITQITAQQNIDPSRVYVTGFSAGGFETWRVACQLSTQVAAVAIVSDAMSQKTMNACNLHRPISELLIIGTADTELFNGIPGQLPGASQATAFWRKADGCAAEPVDVQHVSTVNQETWTSCRDGTTVGLYEIAGAGHVWPPYGTGAPQDYPTSEEVWSFLSAHSAAPLTLTSTDARIVSVTARRLRHHKRAIFTSFRVGEPVAAFMTLGPGRRAPVRESFLVIPGSTAPVRFDVPRRTAAGGYAFLIVLEDVYGREQGALETVRVPRLRL